MREAPQSFKILLTMCPKTQCYIPGYKILQEHHIEYFMSQVEFCFSFFDGPILRRELKWGMAEWMVVICVCVELDCFFQFLYDL